MKVASQENKDEYDMVDSLHSEEVQNQQVKD